MSHLDDLAGIDMRRGRAERSGAVPAAPRLLGLFGFKAGKAVPAGHEAPKAAMPCIAGGRGPDGDARPEGVW